MLELNYWYSRNRKLSSTLSPIS